MGKGYGIEQWEIEEMNEHMKQMDPVFDNHPTVVEQRKRTAEFIEGFQRASCFHVWDGPVVQVKNSAAVTCSRCGVDAKSIYERSVLP